MSALMSDRELKGKTAITGLGITEQGRVYGHDASWFAAEAVRLAVEDSGLRKDEIDGLLVNQGVISIKHWTGVDADPVVMRETLERLFADSVEI